MARKSDTAASQPAPSTDVYTMAEAAALKGVSYHTVSRAVRRGKLPATRLGRMALISADELRAWRPMRERAPRKYRRREPNPGAAPAMVDLASAERVALAGRLSTLYEMLHSSAAELPLSEFLSLLADRLAAALGLRRAAVWALLPNNRAERLAAFGPPLSMFANQVPLSAAGELRDVLEGSSVGVVEDVAALMAERADELIGVGQLFVAPLRVGSRQFGFIVGDNNGEPFALTPEQTVLAQGLANQAALAIERSRLLTEERRRSEQLAAIIDHVGEAVFASDAEGNLVLVNAAARELLGLGDAEASPEPALTAAANKARRREFDGSDLPDAETPIRRAIRGETVRDREYVLIRPDGREVPVRTNARPITTADGQVIGAVAITQVLGGVEARVADGEPVAARN